MPCLIITRSTTKFLIGVRKWVSLIVLAKDERQTKDCLSEKLTKDEDKILPLITNGLEHTPSIVDRLRTFGVDIFIGKFPSNLFGRRRSPTNVLSQ